jgi:hypothetical protein
MRISRCSIEVIVKQQRRHQQQHRRHHQHQRGAGRRRGAVEQLAVGELLEMHHHREHAAVAQHRREHADLHEVEAEPAVGIAQRGAHDELAEEQRHEQQGGLRRRGEGRAFRGVHGGAWARGVREDGRREAGEGVARILPLRHQR